MNQPSGRVASLARSLSSHLETRTSWFIRNESGVYLLLGLLLTVLSLAVIWLNRFPPLQDYPYHLVRMHMIRHFMDAEYGFSERAILSLFPTPYIIADYLSLAYGRFAPLHATGKLVLSTYILLMFSGIAYLTQAMHKQSTPFGLLGFALVFNWFFNMGFISFIFSIPFFLLALGYWWKHKLDFTPARLVILTSLIACVYLSHPFTFCFLFLILFILSMYYLRDYPKTSAGLLGFIPSIALLAATLMRDLPSSEIRQFLAFYIQDVPEKLSMAFGDGLPYFTSFKPWREQTILYLAGGGIMVILVAQFLDLPGNKERKALFLGASSLLAAYFLLPDHLLVPQVGYVANRILILFAFLLIFLPAPSTRAGLRLAIALFCFVLSAAQISLMFISFHKINKEFSDLYAAMQHVPARARLTTWSRWGLSQFGNISPIALFSGYYYVENAGAEIPLITDFAGPLRSIQFKDQTDRERSLEDIFTRGCAMARKNGHLVIYANTGSQLGTVHPEDYGCAVARKLWRFSAYPGTADKKTPHAPGKPANDDVLSGDAYFTQHYYQQKNKFEDDFDYLLLYGPIEDAKMLHESICYDLIFSMNNAHALKHVPACELPPTGGMIAPK